MSELNNAMCHWQFSDYGIRNTTSVSLNNVIKKLAEKQLSAS